MEHLTDAQWALVEPHLPKRKPSKKGGRPPADSRACFEGVLWILRTGVRWNDHALVVAYPHIRAGWFTSPASTAQARVGSDAVSMRGIPCGGRIQFDPSADLDTLGLSRSGKIIMRALQDHGAFVGDYSGAITLHAENSDAARSYWSGGVLDKYELLGKIDMSRFRVVEFGPLLDNGNGN